VGGPGRPRALVAVSRVAPDIVTVRLVRQDRRPCRRSKISAGLPSRTRGRAHSRSLITNSLVTPSPNVGPLPTSRPAHGLAVQLRSTRALRERLADAAVVCRGSEWETRNVRGQSSKTFQQIALRRGWSSRPALEPPWEVIPAASLASGRVLTLPQWRKRKQRLP
jgi:hypothetical protein